MKTTTSYLSTIAGFLVAVLPGIYLVNYIGIILFRLPYQLYYILLVVTAIGYGALLFAGYRIVISLLARRKHKNLEV